jgi:hypothetical protein
MTTKRPRNPRRRRRLIPAALAASGLALGLAGSAAADSIVYVQGGNVWIAKPDGSGRYQVTRDGTEAQPYRSPSQADDGTIAASFGHEIVRMRQNGSVINRMDPPPLTNSVGSPVDGVPGSVAISPDGARIAYTLVSYECPIGGPACGARPATAITPADRMAPTGNLYTSESSWVTNTRILTFAGYQHQVNTYDVGQPEDVHWFDDEELAANSTDQSDGEVNRQGTYVATIRGYGDDRTVMWLKVRGNVQTGTRADGTLLLPDVDVGCVTTATAEIAGPTWSPSGTALAWYEEGAIHVWDDVARCGGASSKPVIPGGSEPDWGPANVNPGPREGEGVPGPPPGGGGQPPADKGKGTGKGGKAGTTSPAKPGLKLASGVRLRSALTKGFRVRLTDAKPGKLTVTVKQGKRKVASGSGKASESGTATVTVRFTKAAKRSLRTRRSVKLRISAAGATKTITVKR